MVNPNLEKAKKIIDFVENPTLATFEEFLAVGKALTDLATVIKQIKIPEPATKLEIAGVEVITIKGDKGEKGDSGDKGESIVGPQGSRGEKGDTVVGPKGDKGNDGESIIGPQGSQGKDGKDGSPDTGIQIVNKINELPVEEEYQIDASHIKGLPEIEKKNGGTSFVISRGQVQVYDLSSQLDGSTKTFSLPAFALVFDVRSSSFPYAFRPTTDYTVNGSLMKITFTSEITAAATLAAGQTLYILYVAA